MDDPIKFYADENIPDVVVNALRRWRVDIKTTHDAGMQGAIDPQQLAFATQERRVLLTRDWDFVDIHWVDPAHAGIAYASQRLPVGKMLEALDLLIGTTTAEQMLGQLEFLDRLVNRLA